MKVYFNTLKKMFGFDKVIFYSLLFGISLSLVSFFICSFVILKTTYGLYTGEITSTIDVYVGLVVYLLVSIFVNPLSLCYLITKK